MATLPQVGAQAVILGMAAFNSNAKTVNSQLEQMGRSAYYLERASRGAFGGVEASVAGMGAAVLGVTAAVTGALVAMGAAAVVAGQRYDKQMAFIGAVSGATSKQVNALSDTQLELSRSSTQTASQLANASSELVKAGFDISQVTGETLKAINDLIVASDGELKAADAAVLAQVAVAGFHTTVVETANAATAAVQKSTLTFSGYSDAIRQAGAVASRQGLSIQEFSAAVGVMGLQLKSGSEIGTGFRQMLLKLQDPSDANIKLMQKYGISLYDAQGAARPFIDVLRDLETQFGKGAIASGKITQAQRDQALASLFGARAVKAVSVLIDEGTDAYLKMLDATKRLTAAWLAGQLLLTTTALLQQLRNNAVALGIAFDKGLNPYINAAARSLVTFIQGTPLASFENIGHIVGTVLYNAFANLGNFIDQAITPRIAALGGAFSALGGAIDTVTGTSNTILRVILALDSAYLAFAQTLLKAVLAAIDAVTKGLVVLAQWIANNSTVIRAFVAGAVSVFVQGFNVVVEAITNAINWLGNLYARIDTSQMHFEVLRGVIVYSAAVMIAWGKVVADVAISVVTGLIELGKAFFAWRDDLNNSTSGATYVIGQFQRDVGKIFDNVALGIIALTNLPATMVRSWAENWGNLQGIVGTALNAVGGIINKWLDALSMVPMFAPAIGEARAVIGFVQGIQRYAVQVSNAMDSAGASARAAFAAMQQGAVGAQKALSDAVSTVKGIQLPELHNFAADLDRVNASATAAADAVKEVGQAAVALPDMGDTTDPGSYSEAGDPEEKAKKAAERLAELWRDFDDEIAQETKKTADDIAKAYREATQAVDNAVAKATKDVQRATDEANKQVAELDAARAIKKDQDARRDALDERLKEEERIRQVGLDFAEVTHQRELEDLQRTLDKERDAREQTFKDQLDATARARDQIREEEDHAFEVGQDKLRSDYEARQKIEEEALKRRQEIELDAIKRQQQGQLDALKQDQDRREEILRDRLDGEKEELQKRQEAEQAALDRILDAEKDALKKSQDQREAALRAEFDAEDRIRKDQSDLNKILLTDQQERAKATDEYNDEIKRGVKQSIAQARLDKKLQDIAEKTADARERLLETQKERDAELAIEQQQEAKLKDLHDKFAQEDIALEESVNARKLTLRDKLREEDKKQAEDAEDKIKQLRIGFEAETLAKKSELDKKYDEERNKREDDFARLQKKDEDDLAAYVETLRLAALARKREREDQDRKYERDQETALADFKAAEDARALRATRDQEDADRARRYQLELDEIAFKKQQDKERDDLSKQFEDEDYNRRIKAIHDEYDERLKSINDALEEERQRIRSNLDDQMADYNTHLDERITALRTKYQDKLQDILAEGGTALAGAADMFLGHMDLALGTLQTKAAALLATLGQVAAIQITIPGGTVSGGGGTTDGGTTGGGTDNSQRYFVKNGTANLPDWAGSALNWFLRGDNPTGINNEYWGLSPGQPYQQAVGSAIDQIVRLVNSGLVTVMPRAQNTFNLWKSGQWGAFLTRQYGGTIPGPWGSPQMIMAHGGERYEGMGTQATTMAAVRAAESMWSRGIGTPATTSNNTSYNVTANYGRVQDEGSIARDLSALTILTR